jgi:hypothetical protein
MSWGRNDQSVTANSSTTVESSNGAPIGTYALVKAGGGANAHFGNTSAGSRAATDVDMFGNVTSGAFISGQAVGVFGVDATEAAVGNAAGLAHAGWVVRRAGTGPVTSLTVAGGSGFTNGETITVGNGSVDATLTISTNTSGGIASIAVTNPGAGFVNTASVTKTFNRQKRLSTITVSGTPTGYDNTDVIVVSNATTNATATVSTNSTGGFVSANVTITNVGLFPQARTNGGLVFTALAANGAASNGSGATFAGTLANSTGGTATVVLGGRAGRVHYETLVAMGSLGAQTAPYGTPADVADAEDSIFPDA